jgi:hypothetical protein
VTQRSIKERKEDAESIKERKEDAEMADKTYAGSIKNTGAQVVKAPFSGDNKKGNGTVKTGNDLRGSKNK